MDLTAAAGVFLWSCAIQDRHTAKMRAFVDRLAGKTVEAP